MKRKILFFLLVPSVLILWLEFLTLQPWALNWQPRERCQTGGLRGQESALHVHSISKSFGLSQGNPQSHSEAPELSWLTPGKIQPWALTHMSMQLHSPLLSLRGDQLGMLMSWKWCPQWSIQHMNGMFNTWSIQWDSRDTFFNLLDSKLS